MDQYFPKSLSRALCPAAAARLQVPAGAAGTSLRGCGELPEAAVRCSVKNLAAFLWLRHSSKPWGERCRSAMRPQMFLMHGYLEGVTCL